MLFADLARLFNSKAHFHYEYTLDATNTYTLGQGCSLLPQTWKKLEDQQKTTKIWGPFLDYVKTHTTLTLEYVENSTA